MKILNIEQRSPEWYEARMGKVSGTGLKRIVGTKLANEDYYYELLAQRLSTDPSNDENPMQRGERLEDEAREKFTELTGLEIVEIGLAISEENENLICSPDGYIKDKNEAIEIKCLSSKNHIKAVIDNQIPKDYYPQVVQYFIVNPDLEKLHFFFYDPRVEIKPTHIIEVTKQSVAEDVKDYKQQALHLLSKVENTINNLIKF